MKHRAEWWVLFSISLLINGPFYCYGQSFGCRDDYPADACRIFLSRGECQNGIGDLCKLTCGKCGFGSFEPAPGPPPPPAPVPQPQPFRPSIVRGYWGDWGPYSSCSRTCGSGQQTRYRRCIGTSCIGSSSQSISCFLLPCLNLVGIWAGWGPYGGCSVTCGSGTRTRYRTCVNGGCVGDSFSTISCVGPPCTFDPFPISPQILPPLSLPISIPSTPSIPDFQRIPGNCKDRTRGCRGALFINPGLCSDSVGAHICMKTCGKCEDAPDRPTSGTLTSWSKWGACSKTCGTGTRTRRCVGGVCSGKLKDTEKCTIRAKCPKPKKKPPKKPKWAPWGPYSSCTKTCGGGTKTRKRRCLNGRCKGSSTSTIKCNDQSCPPKKKKGWGPWSQYSKCTKSCGGGTKTRRRKCNGFICFPGSSTQTEKCNVQKCPLRAGIWNAWGPYTKCSKTCGNAGTQTRKRTCKTTKCSGSSTSTRKCNIKPCPKPSPPSSSPPPSSGGWSTCTKTCGTGTRYKFDSSSCKSASSTRCMRTFETCNKQQCPYNSCSDRFKKKRYGSNHACCTTEENPVQRIIGGDGASITNWPWMVLVLTHEVCAGTLIHRQWVMTAAHCLNSNPSERLSSTKIYVGIERYSERHGKTSVPVRRVIVHPQYNKDTLLHDIALIELKSALRITSKINIVDIPLGEVTPTDTTCYTTGWGVTDPSSTSASDQLLKVGLENLDMAYCRKQYKLGSNPKVQKDMIATTTKFLCAGSLTSNKDTCFGDSGGGLVCQRCSSCRWYVAGITSFGFPSSCGKAGYPGLYVKVLSYENWLRTYISGLGGGRWSCPYKHGP